MSDSGQGQGLPINDIWALAARAGPSWRYVHMKKARLVPSLRSTKNLSDNFRTLLATTI